MVYESSSISRIAIKESIITREDKPLSQEHLNIFFGGISNFHLELRELSRRGRGEI
jgi:hypothetical protein